MIYHISQWIDSLWVQQSQSTGSILDRVLNSLYSYMGSSNLILLFYKSSGFLESSPEAGEPICEVLSLCLMAAESSCWPPQVLPTFLYPAQALPITLKSSPP